MTTWALFKNFYLGKKCFPLTEYGLVACLGCLGSFLALRLEDGQALATSSLSTSGIQCYCCRGRSGGHCYGQAPQWYGYQVIFIFSRSFLGVRWHRLEHFLSLISREIVWNKLQRNLFLQIFNQIANICSIIKNGKLIQSSIVRFTILEKEAALGGTWYKNSYPGCFLWTIQEEYDAVFYHIEV